MAFRRENKIKSNFSKISIGLASPEEILEHSSGEVLKPETSQNKEAGIKLLVPRAEDIFSSKVADTFEEAVDLSLDALVRQLQKNKEKTRSK